MAFLSDELEALYKEQNNGVSINDINRKFNIYKADKIKEGNITTTRDLVDHVTYVNGIVNKSSFVTNSIIPRNVVVRMVLDSLPEEMAKKPYDYFTTLKEKLEELLNC